MTDTIFLNRRGAEIQRNFSFNHDLNRQFTEFPQVFEFQDSGNACKTNRFFSASARLCGEKSMLTTAHKQFIELCYRQLYPCWSAMITLPASFGNLHVAKQCIHFLNGQLSVGAHRPEAGHGR